MNQEESQSEQKWWIVTAAVKGMAVPLVLSVLAHLVIWAVVVAALVSLTVPPDMTPTTTIPILVDLAFIEAPKVVPPPVPEQPTVQEPVASPESIEDSIEDVSVAPPVVAPAHGLWRPLDEARMRAADLERLMKVAECPRFPDLADSDLKLRCPSREPGLAPVDEERQMKVAAKLERGRDRQAVRRGWIVASLPKPPAQMSAAREASKKTPGEEVFGPWPWDVRP